MKPLKLKIYPGIMLITLCLLFSSIADGHELSVITDSLKTKALEAESDSARIGIYIEIANAYHDTNSDSAIFYLVNGVNLSNRINEIKYTSQLYIALGDNYCFRGEYVKALQYLDSAKLVLMTYPKTNDLANYHYMKSFVFLNLGDHDKSIEHALLAKELFSHIGNTNMLGSVYAVLSKIYSSINNYKEALALAKQANLISYEAKDSLQMAENLNNISKLYYYLNQSDSAFLFLNEAIHINNIKNQHDELANNYYNLSTYYLHNNEIDSSEYYVKKSEELNYLLDHHSGLSDCYELIARIALQKKDTTNAIYYYTKVINAEHRLGNASNELKAYDALHGIAVKQGRFKQGIEYFKAYKNLEDSLDLITNRNILDFLNKQIEQERYENKLEIENNEIKLRSHQQSIFLIFLFGVVIILTITSVLIIKLQKAKARIVHFEKMRIEEKLDNNNREIVTNVMTSIRRNKAISDLCARLLEIEKKAAKVETRQAISKIYSDLNKAKDLSIWKDFELRFNQVHTNFHSVLHQRFPELTPSELRLCAFLRMNMSTKDISELIGVHPRSVDNARSKIRKKLRLNQDEKLVSFLLKI